MDDYTGGSTFNIGQELFGLAKTAINASAARQLAATAPALGVDEYGQVYQRGAPASYFAGVPPIALIVGGVALLGLVVYLAKN